MRGCIVFIKFLVSGLTSFLIDVALFSLIVHLLDLRPGIIFGPVATATAISRVISAHYNYLCNRFLVFKAGSGHVSYVRYFCLVLIIGSMSWFFTGIILKVVVLNKVVVTLVKICVDVCLFVASYFIQRKFVFAPKERSI